MAWKSWRGNGCGGGWIWRKLDWWRWRMECLPKCHAPMPCGRGINSPPSHHAIPYTLYMLSSAHQTHIPWLKYNYMRNSTFCL